MAMTALYEGIADIFEVDVQSIAGDFKLDGAWDSLAIISTIALLDDLYDIQVPPDKLVECKSVGDIEALIAAETACT
jgi:acyl carrier protein